MLHRMRLRLRALARALALVACAAAAAAAAGSSAASGGPRHAVVLLIDDLGYGDTGHMGAEYTTPFIDALASTT